MMRTARILALCSLAGGVSSAGALAQSETTATYEDWKLSCTTEAKQCYIFQNTSLENTGQRVLGIVVGNLGPENGHIVYLTVPLGIYLPAGIALRVDEAEQQRIDPLTCTANGCEAMMDLTPETLADFERASTVHVAFLDAVTRRQITVGASMAGFTAAYTALQQQLTQYQ